MRFYFSLIFSLLVSLSFSQNLFRETYNKFIPKNKYLQIQKLQAKQDSLERSNDSLMVKLANAKTSFTLLSNENQQLKNEIDIEKHNSKNANFSLNSKVANLEDSINRIRFPIVNCKEEQIIKKGFVEPIIVNTCLWRHIQLIETGTPDYKGRYSWKTELFQIVNDSLVKISNADIFKPDKITELEKMINERLAEDFISLKTSDPECFGRKQKYTSHKLKDMRITFNENSDIVFEIQYALSDACFAVNSASTGFKITEIKSLLAD